MPHMFQNVGATLLNGESLKYLRAVDSDMCFLFLSRSLSLVQRIQCQPQPKR